MSRKMYFVAFLWLFVLPMLLVSSTASAQTNQAKVTINVRNLPLDDILSEIKEQTGASYEYQTSDVARTQRFSLKVSNATLNNALESLFTGSPYTFQLQANKIIVSARMIKASKMTTAKGRVVDADGEPIVGATVLIQGTSQGTATDASGEFALPVETGKSLLISYIGMKPITMAFEGQPAIRVTLLEDAALIDNVVVTGIFTRKQNTYTGAVSSFKGEDLKRTGNLNVVQALANLDPSFAILESTEMGSNPNALPDIQLRGATSFSDMKGSYSTSPNEPLFIVDGFEQSLTKVMDMDMNRVASITVLKDATAKAMYGSKAANGVIVIETLAPEKGRLRVSYKGDLNIQAPQLSDYNLTNAAEKLEIERLAGMYSSSYPLTQSALTEEYTQKYNEILRGVNTDWLAMPTRVGFGSNHSLNIEGGDDAVRYGVNVGYNNVAGVMKGSERNTFTGGFNIQYRYKNLLFKEMFSVMSNTSSESPYGSFSDYAKMNPYWRAYNADGSLVTLLANYKRKQYDDLDGDGILDNSYAINNPMLNAFTNYKNESKYTDLTNNFYLEWEIISNLKAIGRVGITQRSTTNDLFYPSNYATLDPRSSYNYINVQPGAANDAYFMRGLYRKSYTEAFSMSSDVTLNYSLQFGKNLIFANAQYNVSTTKNRSYNYEGRGFAENATEITQARSYQTSSNPYGTDNKVNEIGFLGSLNYSYDSRYLFDANFRRQASSLFGANNRWGNFWSAGIGWNVHNEKFLEKAEWLNNFRIRASVGSTGSQNFSAYQSIATYSFFNDDLYDNVVGSYILAMSNPDLKWQVTEEQNIGIDLTILKKLDITVDRYVKNTSNMLTPITSAPSMGFSTYIENLGKSKNDGIEARVSYRIISDGKRDIMWSIFGTAAHNKNRLVEINDALSAINNEVNANQGQVDNSLETGRDKVKPVVQYAEGVSLSAIWAVHSLGVDPYNGREMFLKKDGSVTYAWDANDKVVVGDALPKVQGTFGTNLDYKGFTLNLIFSYRYGGQYYNTTLVSNVENADLQYNVDKRVFTERWNPETPGVAAKYTRLTTSPGNTRPTSRFVQDYNELRLSTLNIGYDFRHWKFIKESLFAERLRVSLAMNDLLRFSTVKAERGLEYPYAQSFIFSVQATF